ncbi:MAG: acetyl-CoA carboxylase carboxyltransferase subunit alpha [Deltaproteobacteria bacterium]|nr:acetyl-CoA carboxylase carboxyltransferase subunit alpha [Deltaproteobacteria bacterium]
MIDLSQFLDFERPVVEVEEQLKMLKAQVEGGDLSRAGDVEKLQDKLDKMRKEVYSSLTAYQRVRLSRHFSRPFTLDYVQRIMANFVELHGDRLFGDDAAIVGGLARLDRDNVMVVGHQRGRTTAERIKRNFGMPQPEGYRKAQRLFKLAEKFKLPLILFIDTQGAYPGMEAEERGQSEAIASSLLLLASLKCPIISIVIGEGGSGGALALGICDRLLMLENSTYSVITPEGCASILWGKSDADNIGEFASIAAESLGLTAQAVFKTGIVDEIVKEPAGGAHRDHDRAAELLKESLARHIYELKSLSCEELLRLRYEKFRKCGDFLD